MGGCDGEEGGNRDELPSDLEHRKAFKKKFKKAVTSLIGRSIRSKADKCVANLYGCV